MHKILIVEDDADARLLLGRRLAAHHFEVVEADHGDEGIRKAKELKPDLIVLDLKLPGDDGVQIYQTLRQDPSTEGVPVLFLTGLSTGGRITRESLALIASTKHGVVMQGNFSVLGKPYDSKELVDTVRRMIGAA